MTKSETELTIIRVKTPTGLYCRYEGEHAIQPVYITLNLETGVLQADYEATISHRPDGDRPKGWADGRTLAWPIPVLTGAAANDLLDQVARYAPTVLAGASVRWLDAAGSRVGELMPTAQIAVDRINDLIDAVAPAADQVEELDLVAAYGRGEDIATAYDITADTDDSHLAAMVDQVTADIIATVPGVVVPTRVLDALTAARDATRDATRQELVAAAEARQEATRRRDALVHQVRLWGTDADRAIGELAGVSHTKVRQIARTAVPNFGTLTDYASGAELRPATADEHAQSLAAGETGAFVGADGRTVFVAGGPETPDAANDTPPPLTPA